MLKSPQNIDVGSLSLSLLYKLLRLLISVRFHTKVGKTDTDRQIMEWIYQLLYENAECGVARSGPRVKAGSR